MKKLFLVCFLLPATCVVAQDNVFKLDHNYDIAGDGVIDLSSSDADVFITGSHRSDAHVKIFRSVSTSGLSWGDKDLAVEVDNSNGNLRIREANNNGSITIVGSIREEYRIEIEAPKGASLIIRGDDDDYEIKNINGSIKMDIDDGDVQLTGCEGKDFRFSFGDGDITMDRGAGKLFIKADDGDFRVANATFEQINATVDDGDIDVETSLAAEGEYFFNTSDGHLSLNITAGGGKFDLMHDDTRVSTSGNFKTIEKSEERTQLELNEGNSTVQIRAEDATIRLSSN